MLLKLFPNLKPNFYFKNINYIDFEYLKKNHGIRFLIFDKDDTLTVHHNNELHSVILSSTIISVLDNFGRNSFICSNNRNKWEMDWKSDKL